MKPPNQIQIPKAVSAVVGQVLGSHYYNHRRLETLFEEAGAPGDPPEGNCETKCIDWLRRCNREHPDPFLVLGRVLEEFMEIRAIEESPFADDPWGKNHERVTRVLAQYGLSYHQGGRIIGGGASAPSKSLGDILKGRDLQSVEDEFDRALAAVESDPPAAVTAACSLLESIFKVYMEEHQLELPKKASIKPLWAVFSRHLGFDPAAVADDDLKRILSGMSSVVDGIGALRTHTSSAHGRGKTRYRLKPRHARLAIHSAHTLATFIIESWDEKDGPS